MHCFSQIPGLLLAFVFSIALASPLDKTHNDISERDVPFSPHVDVPVIDGPNPGWARVVVPRKDFYLKTRVYPGGDESKDGLYIDTYHIGAGQNAAVLVKEARLFGFFDGATFQLNSYSNTWSFDLNDHYTYDGWVPVLINPFTSRTNFVFENSTLVSLNPIFQGWLVCDWALGQPQLFRYTDRYNLYGGGLPSTCVSVDLVAEDK